MKRGNRQKNRKKILWIFGAVFAAGLATGIVWQAFGWGAGEEEPGEPAAEQTAAVDDGLDDTEEKPDEKPEETPEQPQPTATNNKPSANNNTTTTTKLFYKDGVLVVNKKHPLPKDYAPGENAEAKKQFNALVALARTNGVNVGYTYSGYRSYAFQATLFSNYSKSDGVKVAETYSMRAGHSEHQTGLAFDLRHNSGKLYRNNDKTYDYKTDFIYQHAHEFGFIVRYRADWQAITGIKSEPWHLRYLGVEVATAVFNANMPLETFLGVEGGDYIWNEQ